MTERWRAARDVLCVRLDTIGDVLMTGPAMRALKLAVPGRRITLLTSPSGASAAALLPELDDRLVYEAPWMKPERSTDPAPDEHMVTTLRERDFDAVVIFTVYTQSPLPAALLCHLAGVPLRLARCRENPYGLLTDWVPEREPDDLVRHEVRRQLDLVAHIGASTDDESLAIRLPNGARARARAALSEAALDRTDSWAAIHPGSTASSRRYPEELWAIACRTLAREHGIRQVFTGESSDAGMVERVRELAGDPGPSLAGRLSLAELAALLEAAPVLVSGNTGPVHLAAAVGTPVVDIYALTNPQHTPWGVPSRVLFQDVPCRWCYRSVCPEGHHLCLRGVTPESVVAATLELLAGAGGRDRELPPVPPRITRRSAPRELGVRSPG
jgi:ADP-heptose:LPS heptosyltransferase